MQLPSSGLAQSAVGHHVVDEGQGLGGGWLTPMAQRQHGLFQGGWFSLAQQVCTLFWGRCHKLRSEVSTVGHG